MIAALIEQFDLLTASLGGVAKLRELILSLAVRGKLVPQDPKDEPASELLKKIRVEKDRLIAEGKVKRDKPLAEIGEEEKPYELPEGWEWVRFGAITNFGTTTKVEEMQDDTWVLDLEDIEKDTSRLLRKIRFAERQALSDKNCFQRGDVLYGKLRPYLNKVIVADEPGVCTTEILPVRCHGPFDPHYFRAVLKSPMFLEYVNSKSYGMKMPRLGTEDGRSALFPLAPLAEQSRIVAKVEALMALCDRLETEQGHAARVQGHWVEAALGLLAESAHAEEFRRHWQHLAEHFDTLFTTPESIDRLDATLLQLAVRGKLVPQDPNDEPASELLKQIRAEKDRLIAEGKIKRDKPLPPIADDEKPYELPVGWEWGRWSDLTKWMTYGFTRPMPHLDKGLPIVTAKNVLYGWLDLENVHYTSNEAFSALSPKDRPQRGDILITKDGSIGRAAHVRTDTSFCINQSVAVLWLAGLPVNQDFLVLVAHSPFMQSLIWSAAEGAAIKHISITEFVRFALPIPPLAEQARIVAQVEKLQSLTASLKARLAAAQTKQAHLAEALIGEVLA